MTEHIRSTFKARRVNMSHEAEMPGMKVTKEHLQIICSRYYFASHFVSGKQVLEIGCGPGFGLGYLSRKAERVIGGDYAEDNLRLAQQHYKGRVELILLDAHNLPFKDNCFDVVVAMAAVIYFQLGSFFNECHRVLKRGGILVFCIPNKNQPNFHRSPLSKNYFSVPELSALMSQHFDARFFGAFPVHKELQITKRRGAIVAKVSEALALMPKGEEIKGFLSRLFFGTSVLKEEIEDGMVENIQPEPIRDDSSNFQYRVLYAMAFTR